MMEQLPFYIRSVDRCQHWGDYRRALTGVENLCSFFVESECEMLYGIVLPISDNLQVFRVGFLTVNAAVHDENTRNYV